jgi:hypothetical protein
MACGSICERLGLLAGWLEAECRRLGVALDRGHRAIPAGVDGADAVVLGPCSPPADLPFPVDHDVSAVTALTIWAATARCRPDSTPTRPRITSRSRRRRAVAPREELEARFNFTGLEGADIEILGGTHGIPGGGFVYSYRTPSRSVLQTKLCSSQRRYRPRLAAGRVAGCRRLGDRLARDGPSRSRG